MTNTNYVATCHCGRKLTQQDLNNDECPDCLAEVDTEGCYNFGTEDAA
jgi:hypothetical protein